MAKRKSAKKPGKFSRGCGLSGCLLVLGAGALLTLIGGLVLVLAITKFAASLSPVTSHLDAPIFLLRMLFAFPGYLLAALGLVQLVQIRAIWKGERWGVYGLGLLCASQVAWTVWDALRHGDLLAATNVLSTLLPFALLLWLVIPRWKKMR